jgi:hypothetical protein
MNGMTFTGEKYCNVSYDSERARDSLRHLRSTGANWVAFVVTWYQQHSYTNEIFPVYARSCSNKGYYIYESATPEELTAGINFAKGLGFKIFLKPHMDVLDDSWRGRISPSDPIEWHNDYSKYMLGYARLAQTLGVELFSISTEMNSAERQSEIFWVFKNDKTFRSGQN